jgi:hypothetical protein
MLFSLPHSEKKNMEVLPYLNTTIHEGCQTHYEILENLILSSLWPVAKFVSFLLWIWFATEETLQNWKKECDTAQWFFVVKKYFASLWFFVRTWKMCLIKIVFFFPEKDCHFWKKEKKNFEKVVIKAGITNPRTKGSAHMLSYGILYQSASNSSYSRQLQHFRLVYFCLQSKLTMLLFTMLLFGY